MRSYKQETFATQYRMLLLNVLDNYDFEVAPRKLKCRELTLYTLAVDPYSVFFINKARDVESVIRYFVGETLWYFGGRNDLKFIEKYSKFWKKIARKDGTCNSGYGNLLFSLVDTHSMLTQWEWAFNQLIKDKNTRQAVMHFNRPAHQYASNNDFVCTMYVNFHIRNNKLYLISHMRSQDIILGLTYDIPFFALLLQNMLMLLQQEKYNNLQPGCVLHTSDSMHLYENNYELAQRMISSTYSQFSIKLKDTLVDSSNITSTFYNTIYDLAENNNDYFQAFVEMGGDDYRALQT